MRRSIVRFIICSVILLGLTPVNVEAQKIKYKDLYYLLQSKKYEEAETFLKRFLADPKEADHPNANLQMGLTYKYKAEQADIFIQAPEVWIFTDSAIHFLNKAKVLITDKHVKRNEEYYEEYSKRDMRTGKVSVKAFDIQFSIEDIVENLKTRQQMVGEANAELENVITKYNISRQVYIGYKSRNNDMNEMLIRAKLETIGALDQLIDTYDSFLISFDRMLEMLEDIPHSGYSQKMIQQSITDLATQGESESHFLEPEVKVWNYLEWAKNAKSIILSDILPLKAAMIKYDEELETLIETVKADKVFPATEYEAIRNSWSGEVLLKYDEDPLPIKLFDLKQTELDYLKSSLSALAQKDSTDLSYRIMLAEKELEYLHKMDSTVNSIVALNIDEQIRNYKDFIEERYHGFLGLDKYLKDKLTAVKDYKVNSTQNLEDLMLRNAYVLVDSSRVFIDSAYITGSLNQYPIITTEDYSLGIVQKGENKQGFLVEVNPQRTTSFYYTFPVDSLKEMTNPRAVISTDPSGEIFYAVIYGDTLHVPLDEKLDDLVSDSEEVVAMDSTEVDLVEPLSYQIVHPAVMAKIYKVDGLAWIKPLTLTDTPVGIRINDLGQIIIDEAHDTDMERVTKMLVLDNKDGTLVKE